MLAGQPGEARWAGFPGLNWHAAKNYIKGVGESGGGTLMERSRLIWIGLFVGSAVGGYVPALWGAGMLSFSSVIGSAIGGVTGIWLGYRLGE